MATVKRNLIAALLLLLFLAPLSAQYYSQSSSHAVNTEEGYKFFQTIIFPPLYYAARYEVEIENMDGAEPVLTEFIITERNIIEVSLKAGNYRYRYSAINRMNAVEGRSAWEEFRVIAAYMPDPQSYKPFYGLYFEMSDPHGILTIQGYDIFEDSEFALVRKGSNIDFTDADLHSRNDVIRPNRVYSENNTASLRFTRASLQNGNYNIFIRNPGGLWIVFGEVRVGYKSFSDFTFSVSYQPMIAGFNVEKIKHYDFYGNSTPVIQQHERFNPAGYNMRLSWIPVKTRIGSFGLEAQVNYLIDNLDLDRLNSRDSPFGFYDFFWYPFENVTLNLLYQIPFAGRWQHNIRLGAGFGSSYLSPQTVKQAVDKYIENINNWNDNDLNHYPFSVSLNLGYSAQFFIWKNLYLEAGLEINYLISTEPDYPLNYLMFRPGIGIGWQFGRWAEYNQVAEGLDRGQDFSVPVTQPPEAEHLLSLNWHPMVLLSGFETTGYDNFFGTPMQVLRPFNPLGFSLRYAYLPLRWEKNKLGFRFEIGALWHVNQADAVPVEFIALDTLSQFTIGILYQRVLADNWHINAHAGLGISNNYNYGISSYYSDIRSAYSPAPAFAANAGVSAQFFFIDNFFLEMGIDFTFIFSYLDLKIAMRPGIAFGYQFKRNNSTGLNFGAPNEYIDPFFGLPDLEEEVIAEAEPEEPEIPEEPRLQIVRDNSDRFNSFGVSLGTSFIDPLLIGTINVTFALTRFLYFEAGLDIGFLSKFEDVQSYISLFPFLNLGVFLPFSGKGGFFTGAGAGYMMGTYGFDYGSTDISLFAANFFAGLNLGNVINLSYSLRTNFSSVSHKLSLGYVIRVERR